MHNFPFSETIRILKYIRLPVYVCYICLIVCVFLSSSSSLQSWENDQNPMSGPCQHLYYKHQGTFGVIKTDICCRKYSCTIWQINEGRRVLYTCINSNYIAQITTLWRPSCKTRVCAAMRVPWRTPHIRAYNVRLVRLCRARKKCAKMEICEQRLLEFFDNFCHF